MLKLKDKVVVVTGGSSGIGKAIVKSALENGAFVAACGRNYEKLIAVFPDVDGNRLFLKKADVATDSDCADFIAEVLRKFNRIDILINNAGITMRALFEDVQLEVLREVMDVNFWGTVQCTKHALPAIIRSTGVIAGVSSIAGYRGLPGRTGYSASKFAMQGFLESLRTELQHTGVHVMWVSPGFTASNIRNNARAANGSRQGETPLDEASLMSAEQCAAAILQSIVARKRTVVMTIQGKLTVWLNKLFPSMTDRLVYRHFKKENGSPLS